MVNKIVSIKWTGQLFRAILVANEWPPDQKEKLRLYMENCKRSGGGGVSVMQMISDGVMVLFEHPQGDKPILAVRCMLFEHVQGNF